MTFGLNQYYVQQNLSCAWCQAIASGILLRLYIQPNATKTIIIGEFDGALKIRLRAPPIDGQANHALVQWLAKQINIPRQEISIKLGHMSRRKLIEIKNQHITVEGIVQRLAYENRE